MVFHSLEGKPMLVLHAPNDSPKERAQDDGTHVGGANSCFCPSWGSLKAVHARDDSAAADEEAHLAALEKEYTESIEKVMKADDKLAAAHAEIKRQASEIATLKISRDGYMNGKKEITRLLEAEQLKFTK